MQNLTQTIERSNALSAEGTATLRRLGIEDGEERIVGGYVVLRCKPADGYSPPTQGVYTFRRPDDPEGREAVIVVDWGDWTGVYAAARLEFIEGLLRGTVGSEWKAVTDRVEVALTIVDADQQGARTVPAVAVMVNATGGRAALAFHDGLQEVPRVEVDLSDGSCAENSRYRIDSGDDLEKLRQAVGGVS